MEILIVVDTERGKVSQIVELALSKKASREEVDEAALKAIRETGIDTVGNYVANGNSSYSILRWRNLE